MASIASLPPELLDTVFFHVSTQNRPKFRLQTCVLVSRLWRDLACPYLFESLQVTLSSAMRNAHDRSLSELASFVASSSRVRHHLKFIVMRAFDDGSRFPADTLANVFRSLHRLERVCLVGIYLDYSITNPDSLPALPSLERLEVRLFMAASVSPSRTEISSETLLQYTSFFGHIKELYLEEIHLKYVVSPVDCSHKFATVDSVVLCFPVVLTPLLCAIEYFSTRGLHTFQIHYLHRTKEEIYTLTRFFSAMGPALKHIDLGVFEPPRSSKSNTYTAEWMSLFLHLDLHPCTRLESLGFMVQVSVYTDSPDTPSASVRHALYSRSLSTVLQDIVPQIAPPWTREFRPTVVVIDRQSHGNPEGQVLEPGAYWEALEERLVQRVEGGHLRKIKFVQKVDPNSLCARGPHVVNALFPRLATKGVLEYCRVRSIAVDSME